MESKWNEYNIKNGIVAFSIIAIILCNILTGCTQVNSLVANRDLLVNSTAYYNSNYPDTNSSIASNTNYTSKSQLDNNSPVVQIKFNETIIGYNQEITFFTEAFDPDGDELEFNWIVNHGEILQKAANVLRWKSPNYDAEVEIACEVNDKRGGIKKDVKKISVIGAQMLKIKLEIAKESLYVITRYSQNTSLENTNELFVPLVNANVRIPAMNVNSITDNKGEVIIRLERSSSTASESDVIIKYLDYEIVYSLPLTIKNQILYDNIKFLPGYANVTIALAKGDSFLQKRGGIELRVGEFGNTDILSFKTINDVLVQFGTNQVYLKNGYAFVSSSGNLSETIIKVNKNGYIPISINKVPVLLDSVTLVNAKLCNQNLHLSIDPIISWIRPYYGETNVSVVGPYYIGFGQPMEKSSIFDDIELAYQEGKNQVQILKGYDIKQLFDISWEDDFTLKLVPKKPLLALTKYNISLIRWNARTLDGRQLKSYSGLYSNFITADDANPKVISITPKNGETNVSRSGPFEIKFNVPMDRNSLSNKLRLKITRLDNRTTVELDEKSISNYFNVQWNNGDTTLSFVPKFMLPASVTFLVQIIEVNLLSKSGKRVENLSNIWTQFTTGLL